MQVLFLDAETYYDDEYSLRKMTIPEYVLSPEYEEIMWAVAVNDEPSHIVDGPDFPKYLAQFDPAQTITVAFNALFDSSILSWRHGFVPFRLVDTMGMARAVIGYRLKSGASLKMVAEALGLEAKGTEIENVKGMRRRDILAAQKWGAFSRYALRDNDLNRGVLDKLMPDFPGSEFRIMDMVLRCAVEPRFQVDVPRLKRHLDVVKQSKQQLVAACGAPPEELMSNAKFADALTKLGVQPGKKTSKTTGRETWAFAKTDGFMEELKTHADTRVQALAAARLGLKSTIEETRSEKLLRIAALPWQIYRGSNGAPMMPVPLAYGKPHTHRLAGEWGMNMQNLPAGRGGQTKEIRNSLIVPPDHEVITADLGQIECRLNAWFCGETKLLDEFANKLDPYSLLGESIFGYPVDRKGAQKVEGFIGKTGILGLGYGCGADRFFNMVVESSRVFGIDLTGKWDFLMAQRAVSTYRVRYPRIPAGWARLDDVLASAWLGLSGPVKMGPVIVGHGYLEGPGDLVMRYGNPRRENDELWFDYGREKHKLYGAKFLENIIQFLARMVVMNAALRIQGRGNQAWYKFVLQAHDELVYIVPKWDVDNAKTIIHEEMTRRPSFAADLPLTADVGTGPSYGEAK